MNEKSLLNHQSFLFFPSLCKTQYFDQNHRFRIKMQVRNNAAGAME